MTTLKGRGGPGRGQGRKPRPGGARRKDYYLSNEVIEYLNRNGNQSAEIERLVRAEMDKPSYTQIAESFDLWGEYVDPDATMTREQFDTMSVDEKVKIQRDLFGKENQ